MQNKIFAKKSRFEVICVNQSDKRMPRKFIQEWVTTVWKELGRRKVISTADLSKIELTVVFLDLAKARKLNKYYRRKNYATDVLSFGSMESHSLGELLLSPDVVLRQSKEHGLPFRQELAYMILHGILHLLGFVHEGDETEAEKMFAIQDSVYEKVYFKCQRITE